MEYKANTPDEYVGLLPEDRQAAVQQLRQVLLSNLPAVIEETMAYGMIGYVIPHTVYPKGYHVNPSEPLPFMSIASQKHHIALYHMGIYTYPELLPWLAEEYDRRSIGKLDMGKGCIRFRNPGRIPFDLVAELCGKVTVEDYISRYEQQQSLRRKRPRKQPGGQAD